MKNVPRSASVWLTVPMLQTLGGTTCTPLAPGQVAISSGLPPGRGSTAQPSSLPGAATSTCPGAGVKLLGATAGPWTANANVATRVTTPPALIRQTRLPPGAG